MNLSNFSNNRELLSSCWANICYFVPRPTMSSSTILLTFRYLENERQKSGSLNSNLVQNVIQRLWFLLASVSSNSVTVIATSVPSLSLATSCNYCFQVSRLFCFYNNSLLPDDPEIIDFKYLSDLNNPWRWRVIRPIIIVQNKLTFFAIIIVKLLDIRLR